MEQAPLIALAGIGKIARDQHLPSIAATGTFTLAATLSRNASLSGVPAYRSLDEMCAAHPDLAAIALCTPPQVRYEQAHAALEAGLDVFLEKPPAATLGEIEALAALARDRDRVLFASWHSRFARQVPVARDWLADRTIRAVDIRWREDVRHWHPGQDWLWQPGGMGVFDPGINALSILTEILPGPIFLRRSDLYVPENRATPIAARLEMETATGAPVAADFDFRETGPQIWEIRVETDAGSLLLHEGGAALDIASRGIVPDPATGSEYEELYRRFARLVTARQSEVDITPLTLVSDAFLLGRQIPVEPFHD